MDKEFRCDRYVNCTDCPIKETCFYLFDLPFGKSDTDAYLKIYDKGKADAIVEVSKKVYKHFEQHNKIVFDKYEICDEISQIVDEYYVYFKLKERLSNKTVTTIK